MEVWDKTEKVDSGQRSARKPGQAGEAERIASFGPGCSRKIGSGCERKNRARDNLRPHSLPDANLLISYIQCLHQTYRIPDGKNVS